MEAIPRREFERLVAAALDEMPPQLMRLMDNVAVVVADRHPTEDLLGLYEGVPLTERGDYGGMVMPDVVTLYRLPLCEFARDEDELVEEVMVTVVHEIAHHFGIDDDEAPRMGLGMIDVAAAVDRAGDWYRRLGFTRISGYRYRVR